MSEMARSSLSQRIEVWLWRRARRTWLACALRLDCTVSPRYRIKRIHAVVGAKGIDSRDDSHCTCIALALTVAASHVAGFDAESHTFEWATKRTVRY